MLKDDNERQRNKLRPAEAQQNFFFVFYASITHIFLKKLQSPGTIFLVRLGINQQKYALKSIRYRNIKEY